MAVGFVDHYEVLGIDRAADTDTIRSAWRRLARRHHPDVAEGRQAPRRFIQAREAYEVLSDAARRQRYDEWLERVSPARPRRRRPPASPRVRSTAATVSAGVRQGGVHLDALGILHLGITFGFGLTRQTPPPRGRT
jgi:curved DNA-binding protein CbpA